MECIICKNDIQPQHFPNGTVWLLGNNAQPMKEGRCCEDCNEDVIHTRIVSFDIGQVHFDNLDGKGVQKIKNDGLEHKRQIMMSEGEELD